MGRLKDEGLVRGAGLESARCCQRQDLNLVRLRISLPAQLSVDAVPPLKRRRCQATALKLGFLRRWRTSLEACRAFFLLFEPTLNSIGSCVRGIGFAIDNKRIC